ncbi:MAG: amino acid transporter [Marmoricola sp.]
MTIVAAPVPVSRPVARWLSGAATEADERTHPWWKVMCLTGVDYFSTLGYQPGIAALAAGALAPVATLVLVALTLFGALPVYRRVAQESPHGQGSISMLERLLPFWRGKLFVLVLLGFAATDFMITITLSAADASAHVVQNPHVPGFLHGQEVAITLFLVALLGAVFLRGFREAIGVAVALVVAYLVLNLVVIGVACWHVVEHPQVIGDWTNLLQTEHSNVLAMLGVSLLLFPKLSLGMSGFETGVAVMTHVSGEDLPGRIRNTRRLLTTAAVVMSGYLIASSFVTTWLIPAKEFENGGSANGRALAYLAHEYLGDTFGTAYDVSTIAILWFAGASAMAGMLNLVPRYLPRYGMAPEWSAAVRPLVLVLTAIGFAITLVFHADVDAQGGAYATGVLVLMTSAAVAVTLAARRRGERRWMVAFAVISVVFVYTTVDNVVERPDGVRIGGLFVAAILAVSLLSRIRRAFEPRATGVEVDATAQIFLRDVARRTIRLVAHEPGSDPARSTVAAYSAKVRQIRTHHDLPQDPDVIFVEVTVGDPSDFSAPLSVTGVVEHGHYRVLRLEASSVPNALAALLLEVRDRTGAIPHIYFEWTEGNPVTHLLRFLLFGQGEVAPVTREVLRRAEPDRARRPHVHVG